MGVLEAEICGDSGHQVPAFDPLVVHEPLVLPEPILANRVGDFVRYSFDFICAKINLGLS